VSYRIEIEINDRQLLPEVINSLLSLRGEAKPISLFDWSGQCLETTEFFLPPDPRELAVPGKLLRTGLVLAMTSSIGTLRKNLLMSTTFYVFREGKYEIASNNCPN